MGDVPYIHIHICVCIYIYLFIYNLIMLSPIPHILFYIYFMITLPFSFIYFFVCYYFIIFYYLYRW